MAKQIFLDTSALVALLRLQDNNHRQAASLWKHLVETKQTLITSNHILSELLTITSQRVNKKTALRTANTLLQNPLVEVVYSTRELEKKALEIFAALPSKNISFVDTVSFALMQEKNIDTVFSFDKHFQKAGFKLLRK